MNNEWNINFLQNSPLGIQYTYSSKFLIDRSTSKNPVDMTQNCIILFLLCQIFYMWDEFSV